MATPSASSDAGFMMSDGLSRTPRASGRQQFPSSGRPLPSESLGAPSDDEGGGGGDGFADDQVPVRARPTDPANIPRVEDSIGRMVQDHFENFIEGYVALSLAEAISTDNSRIDSSRHRLPLASLPPQL